MKIAGIDFPEKLLSALHDDKLVVFAGAGVSMGAPAYLPGMMDLAKIIKVKTYSNLEIESGKEDKFFGKLSDEGKLVNKLVANELNNEKLQPNAIHKDIVRLFSRDNIKIITTNFDKLFEKAAYGSCDKPARNCPSNIREFLDIKIAHIHGSIDDIGGMILTDKEFGNAYMVGGEVSRFIVNIFERYAVLFVGYSYSDGIMYYLTRALPTDAGQGRFILTTYGQEDYWRDLGITPITYPYDDDNHAHLYKCIKVLSDFNSRDASAWNKAISDIAKKKPDNLDQESSEAINSALISCRHPIREANIKSFVSVATDPGWIKWLDDNGCLNNLFDRNANITDMDRELAWWLAKKYVDKHSDYLFALIANHNAIFNSIFWSDLGKLIFCGHVKISDKSVLRHWGFLLSGSMPNDMVDSIALSSIGKVAIKNKWNRLFLLVFSNIVRRIITYDDQTDLMRTLNKINGVDTEVGVFVAKKYNIVCSYYDIEDLWSFARHNIDKLAWPVLEMAVQSMEMRYGALHSDSNSDNDYLSYRRSAIEEHQQDKYVEANADYIIINVIRDCLEAIASDNEHDKCIALSWYKRLVTSDIEIFHRLAVHVLPFINYIPADEKIKTLIEDIGLHDIQAHHEIYIAMSKLYPSVSYDVRKEVIQRILSYEDSEHLYKPEYRERIVARSKYDLLEWLGRYAPDCALIESAISDIKSSYSDFEPSDHPDFTSYHLGTSAVVSDIKYEELLSKSADECLDLISNSKDNPRHERFALYMEIEKAAGQKFVWGYELAAKLLESRNSDNDLWGGFIRAWDNSKLEEPEYQKVLDILETILTQNIGVVLHIDIARILVAYVRYIDDFEHIDKLNKIANHLWNIAADQEVNSALESINIYAKAINNTAGIITEFWILYMYRMKQLDSASGSMVSVSDVLSDIINGQSPKSILGCSVIAASMNYLIENNEEWVKKNLLPIFGDKSNERKYQAVWSGLLYGNPSLRVANFLKEHFISATTELGGVLKFVCDTFIEVYTGIVVFYVKEDNDIWLIAFLRNADNDEKMIASFTERLGFQIRSYDKPTILLDNWLRKYIEDRINNIPVRISDSEVEKILHWFPYMKDSLPQVVDLFRRLPIVPLRHSLMFDESVINEYPNEVAKFLIHIYQSPDPGEIYYTFKDVYKNINIDALNQDIKDDLNKIRLMLGIN